MHFILLFTTLIGAALAFPGLVPRQRAVKRNAAPCAHADSGLKPRASSSYPTWQAPGSGDVRSPCPGLNSAANHNICPHSGKGYTIPILISCLADAYNIGADFSTLIGAAGIGSNPDPLTLSFDLDQLDHHDMVIEHDASLSRADASTGNNYSFNQTIFDTVLAYYAGMAEATIPVAAKARYMRVTTEAARDPEFTYTPLQFTLSYGETALYLSTMGNPTTGIAPLEYVQIFFEEERLPYAEGWTKPAIATTLESLGMMILALNEANGEELPEGLILGASTYKAVLSGLDPVTGAVVDPSVQAVLKLVGA